MVNRRFCGSCIFLDSSCVATRLTAGNSAVQVLRDNIEGGEDLQSCELSAEGHRQSIESQVVQKIDLKITRELSFLNLQYI